MTTWTCRFQTCTAEFPDKDSLIRHDEAHMLGYWAGYDAALGVVKRHVLETREESLQMR